jgi:hypothetical protein
LPLLAKKIRFTAIYTLIVRKSNIIFERKLIHSNTLIHLQVIQLLFNEIQREDIKDINYMQHVHYLSRHNVQDFFQKQCGFGQFTYYTITI